MSVTFLTWFQVIFLGSGELYVIDSSFILKYDFMLSSSRMDFSQRNLKYAAMEKKLNNNSIQFFFFKFYHLFFPKNRFFIR